MKGIGELTVEELAGLICQTLGEAGVIVTLSGGACVAIWSAGLYVSKDLDFIEEGIVPARTVQAALGTLGFHRQGRHFVNPGSPFFIEFPTGPLMVGKQRVRKVSKRRTPLGTLRLLTPTDCVKDRLAAFFHWNDEQALEQALLVARAQNVNIAEIRRWSSAEHMAQKFTTFMNRLKA